MTFSSFDHHSSQLFKSLEIIKFSDLITFVIATFVYKFHNQLLPFHQVRYSPQLQYQAFYWHSEVAS